MSLKRKLAALIAGVLLLSTVSWPGASASTHLYDGEHVVELHSENTSSGYVHRATLDQNSVEEFPNYVWEANPSQEYTEVKNAPAEHHTGDKPDTEEAVYITHDIIYYPNLPQEGFRVLQYDDEREWCYFYPESNSYHDYIFATLPYEGDAFPQRFMHSAQEAYQNAVLHIQKAGTYRLRGDWHGQIFVDLGDEDETFSNPEARVILILDNVNVTCTVAPALIFYSVYECDNAWEDRDEHSAAVSTSNAGAKVVLADGSVNNFTGENIYRMLRTTYKSDDSQNPWSEVKVQKKLRKIDGTFYSFVSMQIEGEEQDSGVLNIHAGFEGLDSELHLTINGGIVNIFSQDDGINVNEDNVSVLTVNGGNIHILAGLGREGDGIDSNGYMVVNGGTLMSMASPMADSGMDSERGTFINGGTVLAMGSTMDWAEDQEGTNGEQAAMNLQFAAQQSADEAIVVTNTSGRILFAYDPDKDEVAENNTRWYQGAILSSPEIKVGQTYHVYVGGDVQGVDTAGIYDVSQDTMITGSAKQQCFSAEGSFARPAPPMGPPSADSGPVNPDGRGNSSPVGFGPPPPPPPPMDLDPANPPPPPPGMGGALPNSNGERAFVMKERVNGFQAVTDYEPVLFTDVTDGPFYKAILWSTGTKIATGEADGLFHAENPCTRGQAMLYLWRAAGSPQGGDPGGHPPSTAARALLFPRVAARALLFPKVVARVLLLPRVAARVLLLPRVAARALLLPRVAAKVLLTPKSWTVLLPKMVAVRSILNPRAIVLAVLRPMTANEGIARTPVSPFTDVDENNPCYQAVQWAVQSGITNGVTPTTFEPDRTLTRGQAQTFLYRWAGSPETDSANLFTDVMQANYYYNAVC